MIMSWYSCELTYTLLKPYLLASDLVGEETWQTLMQQMLIEMLQEDSTCISPMGVDMLNCR